MCVEMLADFYYFTIGLHNINNAILEANINLYKKAYNDIVDVNYKFIDGKIIFTIYYAYNITYASRFD